MKDQFIVLWHDSGEEPKCEPNPLFPNGIKLDLAGNDCPSCIVELPYPAKRIGHYHVKCRLCRFNFGITTAGRGHDPRSARLPCHINPRGPSQ